jgi:hypothetical protein
LFDQKIKRNERKNETLNKGKATKTGISNRDNNLILRVMAFFMCVAAVICFLICPPHTNSTINGIALIFGCIALSAISSRYEVSFDLKNLKIICKRLVQNRKKKRV